MSLFGSFGDAVGGGAQSALASVTPNSVLNSAGGFSMTGAATGILSGAVEGGMRNLLGMDPKEDCPAGGGPSGAGAGSGDNDPCGSKDDPLKSALLGLGMALAGPSIAAAGDMIGSAMDSGLGAVTGAVGGAISGTAAGIGGAIGLEPGGPGQSLLDGVIGAGAGAALTGKNSSEAAASMLNSASSSVKKNKMAPSAISASTVSKVNAATKIDASKVSNSVSASVSSGIGSAASATKSAFSAVSDKF